MKILFDNGTPKPIANALRDHQVVPVQREMEAERSPLV
jgi:hypothetical protein